MSKLDYVNYLLNELDSNLGSKTMTDLSTMIKEQLLQCKENKDYLDYINKHITNVQLVWKALQQFCKGEFYLPDHDYVMMLRLMDEHDKSKFSAEEFLGYRQHFYPTKEEKETKGFQEDHLLEFNNAWNHHQKSNPHHWEYWVMVDYPGVKVLPMPCLYVLEMLCDWTAMSLAFKNDPAVWFESKKSTMMLDDKTVEIIVRWMPLFQKVYELLKEEP